MIHGGNSNFHVSGRRAETLAGKGIWGDREGYCLMVDGPKEVFEQVEPIFATLAAEGGYPMSAPLVPATTEGSP